MVIAVVLVVALSVLVAAWMALTATKSYLATVEGVLMVQGYLNSFWSNTLKVPELYLAISTRHDGWTRMNIRFRLRDVR